jgi:hypothetical protein
MAFVRSASPKFFAPATFNVLGANGELIVAKFDCQFKRLKHSELTALRRDLDRWSSDVLREIEARARKAMTPSADGADSNASADAAAAAATEAPENMVSRKVLERVMTGWRAVQGPDGSDLPFSLEALDATEEEFPGFTNACSQAFWSSCEPKAAAHLAAKN